MYYQVLLVDDEEIVCNGLRRFLDWESCGYQVTDVAHSVDQALSCLEQRPIDLVITDIRMPVRNGLQLLEAIQEDYPEAVQVDFRFENQVILKTKPDASDERKVTWDVKRKSL